MPERIFLTFTNATAVPYQGSTIGHHIVLNYIDSNGNHHILQGKPQVPYAHNANKAGAFIADAIRPDGISIVRPPFGKLQSELETRKKDEVTKSVLSHTMIAEGDDLSSRWARMKEFGDEVNKTGYEYHPTSQNSNSFAAEALRCGGFFGPGTTFPEIRDDRLLAVDPASGTTRPLRVPAFSARLKNPINIFEHRFTRWPREANGDAPDSNQPASVPQDGLDRAGTNKPIRYLSRRIGAAPAPTESDVVASDTAFAAPPAFSPGRPTTIDDRFANWIDSDGAIAPLPPHRPVIPAEDNRPRGIFSGKPMPIYPVRPPIFGFPEPGTPDGEDWLLQLLAPRGRR